MDAVLVAMSCFALLCQEAEIRCGSDEVTVTYLVPNYHVYQELAQASNVLTTGKEPFGISLYSHLFFPSSHLHTYVRSNMILSCNIYVFDLLP